MNFRETVCKMKYPDFDSDNPLEKYVKILIFFINQLKSFSNMSVQIHYLF